MKILAALLILTASASAADAPKTYTVTGSLDELKLFLSAAGSSKRFSWDELDPVIRKFAGQVQQQINDEQKPPQPEEKK